MDEGGCIKGRTFRPDRQNNLPSVPPRTAQNLHRQKSNSSTHNMALNVKITLLLVALMFVAVTVAHKAKVYYGYGGYGGYGYGGYGGYGYPAYGGYYGGYGNGYGGYGKGYGYNTGYGYY